MSIQTIQVRAPSRLHFGMLSLGDPCQRQYGGVGVMIDSPGLILETTPCSHLRVYGPHARRIREFACQWARYRKLGSTPKCRFELVSAPRQHIGLGTGTQLALSVATSLNALYRFPTPSAAELAASVSRGERSAVGTYGFVRGGLVIELGKRSNESFATLERRVPLPESWRFVLIVAADEQGPCGETEKRLFRQLPLVPRQTTDELKRELREHLVPAAETGCIERFGESVYRYGLMAGKCFAPCQGGPFANERLAQWVRLIRGMGVGGVGQSSWGPTLFALLPDADTANRFAAQFRACIPCENVQLVIAAVNNVGYSCTGQDARGGAPDELASKESP